jgi:hypothetical protein
MIGRPRGGSSSGDALGRAPPLEVPQQPGRELASTRRRERAMQRFKSHAHAQRFRAVFSAISPHFRLRRHLLSAYEYRTVMADRFTAWRQVTGTVHTS